MAQQNDGVTQWSKEIRTVHAKMGKYIDSIFQNTEQLNKCVTGCTFLKFNIDRFGSVITMQANQGTPGYIDSVFQESLISTKGLWSEAKKKSKDKTTRTYLLPILYSISKNCVIDSGAKELSDIEKLLKPIPTLKNTEENLDYSFMHMITFGKVEGLTVPKMTDPLNVFILPPLRVILPWVQPTPYNK